MSPGVASSRLAIIIPAWNEAAFLADTLAAATAALDSVPAGFRATLIVVDNNSTDDTACIAQDAGARVVFEPINQIARARNAGAAAVAGEVDYLFFVDADTSVSAELLQAALQRLQGGDVIGGGALLVPDRSLGGTPKRLMDYWNGLSRLAHLAAGCFVYCRADAFATVGGFNERAYAGEEILLSRKLKRLGREQGMRFEIIQQPPIVTSVRKLDWYTPMQLLRQSLLVLIPGAIFSKRLCGTWYENRDGRQKS